MKKGFFEFGDGSVKGKGISSLQNAKQGRNSLLALFGGAANLPSSIMRADRAHLGRDVDEPSAIRNYNDTAPGIEKSRDEKLPDSVRKAYYISGRGCEAGALSKFPQNIGRSMVLLYSEPGDIVFDPHAGHNSRMDLCVKAGRNYVGCDISNEFMKFNFKRADELRERFPNTNITLHHCDSRSVPVKSKSANFSITSPPYYDIEEYGDEPEQLGKAKTYEEFLKGMQLVMNETYRVLRYGSYSIWFVNDFRRKKKFHTYHIDIIRLANNAGFTTHDILIVDLGKSIRDCFTNQIVETRILPKRHEFGLVFKKIKK